MRMHDPPHPGRLVKEAIESLELTIGQFAEHIGVSRSMVSRIVKCRTVITADMSLLITQALGTTDGAILFRMQNDHDLWQAEHAKRKKIRPIRRPAKLAKDLQEMIDAEAKTDQRKRDT